MFPMTGGSVVTRRGPKGSLRTAPGYNSLLIKQTTIFINLLCPRLRPRGIRYSDFFKYLFVFFF